MDAAVSPYAQRIGFQIEDLGGSSVRFVVPARRTWEGLGILSVALVAWLVCEILVGGVLLSLLTGRSANPGGIGGVIFLGGWLAFWTYGGLLVVYQWLWVLAGVEVLELHRGVLHLERSVPGLVRAREYPLAEIRDLRLDEDGPVRFSWRGESVELAESLEPLSARVLLEEIAVRQPLVVDDSFFASYE